MAPVYLVDGKNESALSNVPQRALGVLTSGYVVAQMEQREDSWAKKEQSGTFRAQASEVGLTC